MASKENVIAAERARIQTENRRRAREVSSDLYAPWQPAEMLMRAERKRVAAMMLQRAGIFPGASSQCLQVGFGSLGWLADLISWGVPEPNLCGIELEAFRARQAQRVLPRAQLLVGDATALPWADETFHLVVVSTVFTSVLDHDVRRLLASEIARVIKPGGGLLWYDFAVNNPRNPHVRGVDRRALGRLFPDLEGQIRSVTLAPPLARFIAPKSWALATLLGAVPLLRTHLLGVLVK